MRPPTSSTAGAKFAASLKHYLSCIVYWRARGECIYVVDDWNRRPNCSEKVVQQLSSSTNDQEAM